MNIIIPLGGKGERFYKNGYKQPKPLIPIFDKCMIEYVIDNLNLSNEDRVYIIYNSKLDNYSFCEFINKKYPFINLIKIMDDTKGAVETLYIGLQNILVNNSNFRDFQIYKKCLILDCDTYYTQDIVSIFKNLNLNTVFYTKNYDINAIYSYIELNDSNLIINIKEKNRISDNANTGAYAFIDINIFYNYCKYVLENNITFNNEPYTSCVISEMIKMNIPFYGYELDFSLVFSLGTPLDVNKYIDNTYAFLFDLDGTLVITDDIYFNVWREILIKFNIVLTKQIFSQFIQGNNDKYVLNTLLANIPISLNELSELKDFLFIQNINQIKIVKGMYDTIKEIKKFGHKLSIVTNCNSKVANQIIKHINIDKFIDFIISSEDCINGKPNSEPYKNAIKKYNKEKIFLTNQKCFIFEDSKTGILSAKGINPKLLIGVETIYNSNELLNIGVDISIPNFNLINIHKLIENKENNEINSLKNLIKKNSVIFDINDIWIDENKLKGGFISDVINLKITTNNDKVYSLILKYENKENNTLSIMAKNLDLYEREYYFYTNISSQLEYKINIPKFYNLVRDDVNNNIGIVLENLYDKNYKVNLNLNQESIDVTLKIIDRIAKMHSQFWNTSNNLKCLFPKLKNSVDGTFNPFFSNFIKAKYELFKQKWFKILNKIQIKLCDNIYNNFSNIQERLSIGNHLTLIHGDVKSPNIFYDINNNNEPYFIDWQHCGIGKGVQDLVFLIIESFDINNIKSIFNIVKYYYYKKLIEYGIKNYSFEEYEKDIYDGICYIPFFTSIWFGSISQDELIDKNFPFFLISKLFYLIEILEPDGKNQI